MDLLTITQVAQQIGCPMHVARYAVASRGIEPVGRVGITRVFSREQVPIIAEAVKQTAANRIKHAPE